MAFVNWKDQYCVGSQNIDGQHQVLFKLVNELHEAMSKGSAREILDSVLDRLIKYTQTHFKEEEAIMAKAAYPDLVAHRAEHEALTRQVLDLQRDFRAGKVTISLQVMQFLGNWLDKHIMQKDQQYVPFLRSAKVA